MAHPDHLDTEYICLFWQLYGVIICFADDPLNSISKIGGGRISVPDDQAVELDHYLLAIRDQYPDASCLAIVQVAKQIHGILDRRSLGGDAFDESFWTNEGFQGHPDWQMIRTLAREFLLRSGPTNECSESR